MASVIDASVLTAFVVENEFSGAVQRYRSAQGALVPSIALVETASAVKKYVQAERASLEHLLSVRDFIIGYTDEIVQDSDLIADASRLAVENGHSIYDCLYLALARLRSAILITADKRLASLAANLGIETELVTPV